MKEKTNVAITCLTILQVPSVIAFSGGIELIFNPYAPRSPSDNALVLSFFVPFLAVLFLLFAFTLAVQLGLKKHHHWAWVSAVILFVLYMPTIFLLPVSVVGIWSLATSSTRTTFDSTRSESRCRNSADTSPEI